MKLLKWIAVPVFAVVLMLFAGGVNIPAAAVEASPAAVPVVQGTLADAIDKAEPGGILQLSQNVTESVTVNKDITLDLNGCSIFGTVTVANGNILTVKDTTTDDFSAADGYGKITAQGNVLAAEGYVAIEEADGTSFHRLDLKIHSANLRPSVAGIYYTGSFGGDQVVKSAIDTYGTALSLERLPSGTNLLENNFKGSYTAFSADSWICGQVGQANGTLLRDILKQSNTPEENKVNGETVIYSASYVKFKDGTVVIGQPVVITLRQIVEKIDGMYESLNKHQSDAFAAMYETYAAAMDHWNIPKTTAVANQTAFYSGEVTAKAGDTVTVAVSVRNNPGILGMLMSVEYDENVLTLTETENGEVTAALVYLEPSRLNSGSNYLWYGTRTGAVKDGTVLMLKFKVAEKAESGVYPIVLHYSKEDTYNANYDPVDAIVVNGSVIIK